MKFKLLFTAVLTALMSLAAVASASAYLHVANARSYVVNHVWVSAPCYQSSNNCWRYPFPTNWYDRISDSYVRVEIAVGIHGYPNHCYRVYAVHGSDASPYITSAGSAPYFSCPG